jgi:hypothetical protein
LKKKSQMSAVEIFFQHLTTQYFVTRISDPC